MMELHLDSIDLLKIDIEGAEKEIFENCSDWIVKVGGLMVELHDNIKPWCSRAFIEATKDFPLAFTKGETIMRFRTE